MSHKTISYIIILIIIVAIAIFVGQGFQNMPSENNMMMEETSEVMQKEEVGEKRPVLNKMEQEKMMMKENVKEDNMRLPFNEEVRDKMVLIKAYDIAGEMQDVSGGNGSGVVQAAYQAGQYSLIGTFKNIPDPEEGYFYEGWVVRRTGGFRALSTGVVSKVEGIYTNIYNSEKDLLDHDFYVLTLEPDDGDPAPAEHILEGPLNRISNGIAN